MKPKYVFYLFVGLCALGCAQAGLVPDRKPAIDDSYALRIYNISDPHIIDVKSDSSERARRDRALVEEAISRIKLENPDLVIVTGDIINGARGGLANNIRFARQLLNTLDPIPWLVIPGNNDAQLSSLDSESYSKADFIRIFEGHGPHGSVGYWKYKIPQRKTVLIGLDSSVDGEGRGRVDSKQKAWLLETLQGVPADEHVIVLIHHPLVVFRNEDLQYSELRTSFLDNAEEIRKVINRFPVVKTVISGHIHNPMHKLVGGIHHVSSPSITGYPNLYSRLDFSERKLRFEHIQTDDAVAIKKSYGDIIGDKFWRGLFHGNRSLLDAYLKPGPFNGTLDLVCPSLLTPRF